MTAPSSGAGSLDDRFATEMGALLGPEFPSDIALAVSGGGDSMAMLALAHNWARVWGVRLWVVTVDHGLRAESAAEAAMVAAECATLGHPHTTLRWQWDGAGNVMDAARRARLALIDGWRGGIGHVLMAHTEDDVAETFLMRLARGAGTDGLAAMAPARRIRAGGGHVEPADIAGPRPPGTRGRYLCLLRPCIGMSRAELRHYARVLHVPWIEDPTNDDPRFDRARLRRLIGHLSREGIDAPALAAAAGRLSEERAALAARAVSVWRRTGAARDGMILLDPDWHADLEPATGIRILGRALTFVAGARYGPRRTPLVELYDRVTSGGSGTLHGCEVRHLAGHVVIFREHAAVAHLRIAATPGGRWDTRWIVGPGVPEACTIRALGEDGWRQIAAPPDGAPPHRAALSLPSVWHDGTLFACKALGIGSGDALRLDLFESEADAFARFLETGPDGAYGLNAAS